MNTRSPRAYSVWPILHRDEPRKFGTGFVVHVSEPDAQGNCIAHLVTCAHVVTKIGAEYLTVRGATAERVAKPEGDDPDLAVIKVSLPADEVEPLALDPTPRVGAWCEVQCYCADKGAHHLASLKALICKSVDSAPYYQAPRPGKVQFTVQFDEQVEPDQIRAGNSGGPLLLDGRVCAVLGDGRPRATAEREVKIGQAVLISDLQQVWPGMPAAIRDQLLGIPDAPEPLRSLLRLASQVPAAIARAAFDDAGRDLPSWPGRAPGDSFAECLRILAALGRVELPGCPSDPLADYVTRVADRVEDAETASRLREAAARSQLPVAAVGRPRPAPHAAARQEALLIQILPDVSPIVEPAGSGPPLRLLPFLVQQQIVSCRESCSEQNCRSVPMPRTTELRFLGSYALETSTDRLHEDLQAHVPELFGKFVGGIPDRVEFFVPRAFAAAAVHQGLDRIEVRVDQQSGSLNAWSTTVYHIDERLAQDAERAQLDDRLRARSGPIKLEQPARNLDQLTKNRGTAYDWVVVGEQAGTQVIGCLRGCPSLICAIFQTLESSRRNLSYAVRTPVPFLLLSRSPEAAKRLRSLLRQSYCLRQLPREVKEKAASGDLPSRDIAAIVDLPEYRCDFHQAEHDSFLNDSL